MISYLIILLLLVITAKLFFPSLGMPKLRSKKARKVVLDSCALIDGRILDLSQGGFMPSELVVPDFVVHELQLLADGADSHKRERARYGLDVIKDLQTNSNCKTSIDNSISQTGLPTDDKLVALAQKLDAHLYTTDFNLQKVAEIAGVTVLNVNDLAQKLRPIALPGEHKTIKILQKGSNPKQGVGYLEDGTMLVVENGARMVGKMVEVEVTRNHQTVSGKMLFGDLVNAPAQKIVPARQPMPRFKTSNSKSSPDFRNSKRVSR